MGRTESGYLNLALRSSSYSFSTCLSRYFSYSDDRLSGFYDLSRAFNNIYLVCLNSLSIVSALCLNDSTLSSETNGFLCHQHAKPKLLSTRTRISGFGSLSKHSEYLLLASAQFPTRKYALPKLNKNCFLCFSDMLSSSFSLSRARPSRIALM